MKKPGTTLILLILCQILNLIIILYILFEMRGSLWYFFAVIAAVILCAADIFLANVFYKNTHIQHTQMKMEVLKRHAQMEAEYYQQLLYEADCQKQIGYELIERLDALEQQLMCQSTDKEYICRLLQKAGRIMDQTKSIRYCEHELTNIILADKLSMAEKKHIQAKIQVSLPADVSIATSDICSIWCNLLNNAIEACEKVPDIHQRHIQVKAQVRENYFYIKVENSMNNNTYNSQYFTTKGNVQFHGLGLKILREIAARYEGELFLKGDGNWHLTLLAIKIDKNTEGGGRLCSTT